MRISDPKPVERLREVEPVDGDRADASADVDVADRVSIGGEDEVRDVASAVRDELASSRSAHLAHIEAAVRNGTYKPDPRLIAERILRSAALDAQIDAALGAKL